MLDPKLFVQAPEVIRKNIEKRGLFRLNEILDQIIEHDKKRKLLIHQVESKKARQNQASAEISQLKRDKKDASALLEEMKQVSSEVKALDAEVVAVEEALKHLYFEFPNILDFSVPVGKDSSENVEVRRFGKIPQLSFTAKSHDEIGEKLGLLDFKKAGEVTGSRFVFLKGLAAQLERALIQFMLSEHRKRGYEEIAPPFLVNRGALTGTGQLPKFEEDVFRIEKVDYFLIPTAEVPVTNYHREEVLREEDLPKKYCAYTPCFRSEAGSYGKDTKGLKRQHQFNKVEMVHFTKPEDSFDHLEQIVADAENILQKLGLPYRVVTLCSGDTGFGSAKTYDIEVWSVFQNQFMEISSCSNFLDYQARRCQVRYRDKTTQKVQYVHTLNGSGLAVGRTLLSLIEYYQKEDGSFDIPEVLKPFMI